MRYKLLLALLLISSSRSVTYYSQTDPRWADIPLTCADGETARFSSRGCGETVVAMLMSTYVDPKYTPDVTLDEFYGRGYCHGTSLTQNVEILKSNGFDVRSPSISLLTLKNYIRAGWMAWIHVEYGSSGHEALIVKMNNRNEFVVYDPYFGIGAISDKFFYDENNIVEFYIIKQEPNDTF